MDFFQIITIDLSDIFANFNVCGFVTSFSNSFYSYMTLLPAAALIALLAALTLTMCNPKQRTAYNHCAVKIVLTLMFLLYPSLGGKIFSVFQCLRVGNAYYFLPSMEYECYVGHHAELLFLAFVFIGLYILGIPIHIFYILKKK